MFCEKVETNKETTESKLKSGNTIGMYQSVAVVVFKLHYV